MGGGGAISKLLKTRDFWVNVMMLAFTEGSHPVNSEGGKGECGNTRAGTSFSGHFNIFS